ncbi:SGNH/GDSL hydrolase family protein [Gluconobacter wancherniae]|uniref:SGNH/GDSL hydrolase family protein n=1 Tax=Gluconobacter wancherniae TaxID=1307955 RepID=UPI001B8D66C6|nr:SGNH/GDSL hydrolase family protein [Gluconobacter wancherniae]MBS1087673.1 SGNH/GDSL hydrolase family protein [Gluconobacter wancherniae]
MPFAPLGCGHANIEDIYEIDQWNKGALPESIEIFRFAKSNLRYLGVIDKEEFQDNIRTILGYFRSDARIFLMNALQKVPKDFEWTRARHSQLNEWQAEIAQEFPNVVLVNVDEFMSRPEDAVSSTHFVRDFYRQVGLHLCSAALE